MATNLEEAQESIATEECRNCGDQLIGEYCHTCGQKAFHQNEYSVRRFTKHALNELTDLESNKIVRTVVALLFKPGLLASEYLSGRKGKFIGPIRLYLTLSAIYFLFAWGTLSDIRGGGAARIAQSPRTIAMARQKGLDAQSFAEKIYGKAERYAGTLRFVSVLVSGLFLSLLYIGMKKFYVEHLIFSLYYYSFDFCTKSIFALAFILTAVFSAKLPSAVLNLFYPVSFLYLFFALRRVYKQRWPVSVVKALVLFVLETLLFIGVNIAGFMAAFSLA